MGTEMEKERMRNREEEVIGQMKRGYREGIGGGGRGDNAHGRSSR